MCPPNISVMGVRTKSAWRVMEVLFRGPTCSHSSSLPSSSLSAASSSMPDWDSGPLGVGASGQTMKEKHISEVITSHDLKWNRPQTYYRAHLDYFWGLRIKDWHTNTDMFLCDRSFFLGISGWYVAFQLCKTVLIPFLSHSESKQWNAQQTAANVHLTFYCKSVKHLIWILDASSPSSHKGDPEINSIDFTPKQKQWWYSNHKLNACNDKVSIQNREGGKKTKTYSLPEAKWVFSMPASPHAIH